jgi:hypothetical protein
MNSNQYNAMLARAQMAIMRGDSELRIKNVHGTEDVYFSLPTAQTSGTASQRHINATQLAHSFLKSHGITQDSNIF